MAKLNFGPWGGIIGRLGDTIGYFRKGQPLIRMKSAKSRKKRSVGQKTTTTGFGLIIKFMPAVNKFTNIGFGLAAQGTPRTAQNLAVSYNTKNAIKGEYPDLEIDYTKIMLSQGRLSIPDNISVDVVTEGDYATLTYRWDVDPNWDYRTRRDRAMVLAYSPEFKKAFYDELGAKKIEGQESLNLPVKRGPVQYPTPLTYVETYIAFISSDGKSISDSLYTGRVEIV